MAHRLTEITPTYHSFAKDQVLTEIQLNEFLEYFDEQDRLSRICLSGVGIVCGFNLSTNAKTNAITITQGAGVTTDGDLIHLTAKNASSKKGEIILVNSITYKYYRPYDGVNVDYHPHFNKNEAISEFEIIPLLEIVSEENRKDDDIELNQLDLENKVALLYLESYAQQPNNCVGVNCENQGVEQVNRLRVLLVDVNDVDRIIKNDELFNSYITIESYLETKTVYVPRVILDKNNVSNITNLAKDYQSGQLLSNTVNDLKLGVRAILTGLGRTSEADAFDLRMNRLFPLKGTTNLVLFQYKYDLLKDLADSFNELKELFLQNNVACCPNIAAFPKHLLLGRPLLSAEEQLVESESGEIAFRHRFHKSPILLDNNEGNKRFESVLVRMLFMVNSFYETPRFVNESVTITPSNVRVPLGKRAVPFYYNFSNPLMRNWDFDRQKFDKYKSILGYRQALAYPSNPYVAVPLRFSIDPYNFFRIEGHQGKLYDDAFKDLTDLKENFSLPFDIKVLGINVDEFDELLADQYKCDFKDLGVLLQAWSSEQECIASEVNYVLSSFSVKDPGINIAEETFYEISPPIRYTKDQITLSQDSFSAVAGSGRGIASAKFQKSAITSVAGITPESSSRSAYTSDTSRAVSPNLGQVVDSPTRASVVGSINSEPDTLGFYLNESLISANGNFSTALEYTQNTIKQFTDTWESAAVVDSTVSLPLLILVSTTNLIELIPSSITDLSDSTLDLYNVEIAKLCSYTKQLQSKYRNPELETKIADKTRSMVSLLVNQLTSICCSSKKLQALLEEVEKRKQDIITRLNFSDFALKNPGLEHQGGAGPGHTFVMVYLNETIRATRSPIKPNVTLSALNALASETLSSGTKAVSSSGVRAMSLSNTQNRASSFSNTFGDQFNSDPRLASIVKPINDIIIQKGTVIADFTLPYLCCSDCAPISFMMPNIPASLTLSSNTYCIDGEDQEIDLTFTPANGVVTVVDSVPGVNIVGSKLTIDGTIFPEALLGTTIKFNVDGESTTAELFVSKIPNLDFTFPDPEANRVVSFTVTGDDHPDFTYAWDFGDGADVAESEQREPTHDYSSSSPRTDYVVTLTVQGIGGSCPLVISKDISFVNITVSIDENPVCFDAAPIPFEITPPGAFADIQGEGVNADKTHFDPALVGPGTYPLSFEGTMFALMTVNPAPSISSSILWKFSKTAVDFSVDSSNAVSFQWSVILPDGKKLSSTEESLRILRTAISKYTPGEQITISLLVENECGSTSSDLTWTIPNDGIPTASLEKLKYCQDDPAVYDIITEHFATTTVISGLGVNDKVTPPTFAPSGLPVGEHEILVDSIVVDTVIIVQRPVLTITSINALSTGFTANGNVPTNVDSSIYVWNFTDSVTGEKLHESIQGGSSVTVNYADFINQDWSELIVELSADTDPCGLVSATSTFVKPKVAVQITLPQSIFCENDTNIYPFTFTPNTEGVFVTGDQTKGVIPGGTQFTPQSLAIGNHTLLGSNGVIISFTVVPQRTISINDVNVTDGILSTSVFLSPGVPLSSIEWYFSDNQKGDELHPSILAKNTPGGPTNSVAINLKNVTSTDWNEMKITVIADGGPCGELKAELIFTAPTRETCKDLLTQELIRINDSKPTKERLQALLSTKDQQDIALLEGMISSMQADVDAVIAGQVNQEIVTRLLELINLFAPKIVSAKNEQNQALVDLLSEYYLICVDVYKAAFLCQGDLDFSKFTAGKALNAAFVSHFTGTNSGSFLAHSIDVISSLDEIRIGNEIANKDLGTEPWKTINFIINAGSK